MVIKQLTSIKSYFTTLNQEPIEQITWGFVLGMFLGLIPVSINSFIITLLIALLKVDKGMGALAASLFGLLGFFIDPLAHQIGYFVLVKIGFLKPLWTALYNMPIMPFTGFNNTVVMGNTVLGLLIAYPILAGVKNAILIYRGSKFKEWSHKIIQNKHLSFLSKIFGIAESYQGTPNA